jgi:hypothetical protein
MAVVEMGERVIVVETAKRRAGRLRLWDDCGGTPFGRPDNKRADEGNVGAPW